MSKVYFLAVDKLKQASGVIIKNDDETIDEFIAKMPPYVMILAGIEGEQVYIAPGGVKFEKDDNKEARDGG